MINEDANDDAAHLNVSEESSSSIQSSLTWRPRKDLGKVNAKMMNQLEEGTTARFTVKKRSRFAKYTNMGDLSNAVALVIMLGSLLALQAYPHNAVLEYLLACGLFGFAGGITNWLAIKMLFDKIPFLVGSGVIPRQFKAIRQTVKDTILGTFFDTAYLKVYLNERSKNLIESIDVSTRIKDVLSRPDMDAILITKMTEMSAKPEGMLLASFASMFGGIEPMVPMIKPMLTLFAEEMVAMLKDHVDLTDYISVENVQQEIDKVMTEKMELLTPEMVKELMEHVIREHLGWLVVWGNVFGMLIGVVSKAVGYGG